MLLALVLLTAPAQARLPDCQPIQGVVRSWCYHDMQVGVGTFFGGTTDGAAFGALALDMKWDLLFPRANIGLHITLGPSLRSFTSTPEPFFGMYVADTIYWHHVGWGVGVGVEAPNAMIGLITEDSPEFAALPMIEVWRDVSPHLTLTGRVGVDIFAGDAYGSVGLTYDFFRVVNGAAPL